MDVRTELASGLKQPFESPVQVGKGSTREHLDSLVRALVADTSKALLDVDR